MIHSIDKLKLNKVYASSDEASRLDFKREFHSYENDLNVCLMRISKFL